jgi:hypothetical protein
MGTLYDLFSAAAVFYLTPFLPLSLTRRGGQGGEVETVSKNNFFEVP